MKVLYIASNPRDENSLMLERDITDLQSRFASGSSSSVSFAFMPALPVEDLSREVTKMRPDILHISAHGSPAGLTLMTATGPRIIRPDALNAFLSVETGLRLVVLNACNSEELARRLTDVVPMAIGVVAEISNAAARESIRLLYERILLGQSVGQAFVACREMVETMDSSAASAVIKAADGVIPEQEFFFVSPKIVARFENNAERDKDGDYTIEVGIVGYPPNTHQIVFFVDDANFATDEDDLADSMCKVIRRTGETGVIWAESAWTKHSDFRVFVAGVTADGEQFTAASFASEAIKYFVKFENKNSGALLETQVADAVKALRWGPTAVEEAVELARRTAQIARQEAARKASRKAKPQPKRKTPQTHQ